MPWTERQHAMLRAMGLRAVSLPAALAQPSVPHGRPPPEEMPSGSNEASGREAASADPGAGQRPAGWPALRAAVATCRACVLCQGRRQAIVGHGPPRAGWLIVGDPPSDDDDAAGALFSGEAGVLLDRMLHAAGLRPGSPDSAGDSGSDEADAEQDRRAYVTPAAKCRPPQRAASADELRACAPHLRQQIALLSPRVIVALGRFAAQALLGSDEPFGRLRGRVHVVADAGAAGGGVPLVVSFHPAYLLRHPEHKALAWEDWCLAAGAAERAP